MRRTIAAWSAMATPPNQPKTPVTAPSRAVGEGWGSVQHYRQEGGLHVIDISAGSVAQLFSGLDPAPFRHKDLDPEVDGYILSAVREIGEPAQAKLVFHLPAVEAASPAGQGLGDAVHNYFAYREWVAREDLRRLLGTGAVSLLIGLAFLFVCLVVRQLFFHGEDTVSRVLDEGLLIVGWVALWRPLEIALYDWWPLWRIAKRNRTLKDMNVEIREQTAP
jgi:hypothetical protein